MNSLIVTVVSMALVLLFGAMAAWALTEYRFRGSTALALFLSIGIMVPIRLGSVAILTMMRDGRSQRHADRADPRLCRARAAIIDLHPEPSSSSRSLATCVTRRAATACRRRASSSR
jgi:ABC-type glycerol-3-phosphate transport system permease component